MKDQKEITIQYLEATETLKAAADHIKESHPVDPAVAQINKKMDLIKADALAALQNNISEETKKELLNHINAGKTQLLELKEQIMALADAEDQKKLTEVYLEVSELINTSLDVNNEKAAEEKEVLE